MPQIEFGWFTPPLGTRESHYTPLAVWQQDQILPVVTQHFDSLWVPDHLYAFDDKTEPFLECMTTLTWLASRYPSVKVGPIVLAVGFRHPPLLAKMATTLQALSGGRFIMAIGAGWRQEEFLAYGYDFPPTPVRVKQLEEAVRIMRLMWTEEAPTFHGKYFKIDNAYCHPQPDPPPIMIGGTGEKLILPLVARLADIWDAYHGGHFEDIDPAGYAHKRDVLHRSAESVGRDPASIVQSYTVGQAKLPGSAGEAARALDALRPLVDLGVRQFILDCGHITSTEPVLRFVEDVMPALRAG